MVRYNERKINPLVALEGTVVLFFNAKERHEKIERLITPMVVSFSLAPYITASAVENGTRNRTAHHSSSGAILAPTLGCRATKAFVEIDLFSFIHTLDPTKVKIFEREWVEDKSLLLQNTVSRTVPLLPVAPDHADNELETSIDRLFDDGGSGSQAGQGGSAGVGEGTNIQPVTEATDIVIEDVAPLQPRRQRKRKTVVADAGGSSHLPKKLREDHKTPSGPSVAGKSRYAVQRLLARAVMNDEVRGELMAPF
uniref:Uncharacterized protein n=1 Tax=Tanacetum cinerariifolium TaxID=118510 RepID=A0A6L2J3W2_TANCI|nr:hypothetical protein [Tanacetum cinerariifolium]